MSELKSVDYERFDSIPDEDLSPLDNWQLYAMDTTDEWRIDTLHFLMGRLETSSMPDDVEKGIRRAAMILLALEEGEDNE